MKRTAERNPVIAFEEGDEVDGGLKADKENIFQQGENFMIFVRFGDWGDASWV